MSYGYTAEGLRCYYCEARQKWVVEQQDGTIREATPEEIEEAHG